MFDKKIYDSYQELNNKAVKNNFIIYGDMNKYNNKFEMLSLPEYGFSCGLMYYDHGIAPQILLLDNVLRLLIGFEKWIICLDYVNKVEIYKQKSISLFYEFVETENCILAICELDISAFNSECRLIWSSGFRDIIENYKVIDGKTVSITCSNGDKSEFELKNGKSL